MKKIRQQWPKVGQASLRKHSSVQTDRSKSESTVPTEYVRLMKSALFESFIPRRLESIEDLPKFKLNPHSLTPDTSLDFYNKLLPEVYYAMHDRGANFFYASLVLSLGEFLGVDHSDPTQGACAQIAAFIEMMHNTFLVYDDFCDGSVTRQGEPSVIELYGAPLAITSCIQAWFQAQNILLDAFPEELKGEALQTIAQACQNIGFAQNFDLGIKQYNYIPLEEEYANHSVNKFYTAHMGTELVFLLKKTDPSIRAIFREVLDNLAIAYHIRDDILNLIPSGVTQMKQFVGEDIYEQKPSFLIIHSHFQAKNSERLLEILSMKTRDEKFIQEAIEIMEVNGSFKYAREQADLYIQKSFEAFEKLKMYDDFGGHKAIERVIDHIANRTY
mmetsp:Transcript_18946/g.21396  ORF Transcript_18946/g.21396 Transcript_18946/m.21396 type:complete len:387 (+) Transcript_18946:90-1250(+)|eukprot:CAMPEP_0115006196 /NCGR_PEP_ID=MMETSP0216-20121206/20344_1 /TAXON_ID=223996 /ORGANISM="Protocruzia adherens, Strain Boccale" /LENGTH=386 /DNA_ID=CAMNT_0002372709 /DNA_START=57 /DNA_END=1217 /DNA_ORIENTATION=-